MADPDDLADEILGGASTGEIVTSTACGGGPLPLPKREGFGGLLDGVYWSCLPPITSLALLRCNMRGRGCGKGGGGGLRRERPATSLTFGTGARASPCLKRGHLETDMTQDGRKVPVVELIGIAVVFAGIAAFVVPRMLAAQHAQPPAAAAPPN